MPNMFAHQLSVAVSDSLNPNLGAWNEAFLLRVVSLPGKNHVLVVSAKNLTTTGPYPAEVQITAKSKGSSVVGVVTYVAPGIRNSSIPVAIQ